MFNLHAISAVAAPKVSSLAVPVMASAMVHVAVIGAFAGSDGRDQAPQPELRQLVRSVSIDVPPLAKPEVPPPPPEPMVAPPVPEPPPETAPKPPPKKKERRAKRKSRKSNTPAKAPTHDAPAPAPAAAPAINSGPGTMATAMTADDNATTAKASAPPAPPRPAVRYDLSGYGAGLHEALAEHRRYPDEARDDELEGEVLVRIVLRRDGTLAKPPKVKRSSGHRCLDREALRMVAAAAPFMALPSDFPENTASFTVPVRFQLDDDEF